MTVSQICPQAGPISIQYCTSFRRADDCEDSSKEYGLRTFIPPSLVGSDEYWHHVATKCFALSTQWGHPTLFLTFAMNRYWVAYPALNRGRETLADSAMDGVIFKTKHSAVMLFIQKPEILGRVSGFVWRIESQKRGLPHAHVLFWSGFDTQDLQAVESVINVRYPKDSPFIEDRGMVSDFRQLIDAFQIHHHSKHCRLPNGKYWFGYLQQISDQATIQCHTYLFARSAQEGNIVRRNPLLLVYSRCRHRLEVIHSKQRIGYMLKYCSKNYNADHLSAQNVLHEGHSL
jgi:hypothetical protein